ncbi:hypothetical protein ENUP19_0346G0010 [Entamoeba nuttalli]|uniref:Uncharacterized protein n=2 Tax=Entamoeba nuttalli TaxID=412467 RepID=K2H8W3_ENTNP|nr:hypothetical protein ENU1_000330 [Entamoeba nuttalli P19]EKE43042.1 hypothetical protein ENU1_000330 [Entamoeba nuttalli P19]|eukprot:XP_008854616.1 hypothetical protein ENU1_000330 [Entamoeba nuttalli P19]
MQSPQPINTDFHIVRISGKLMYIPHNNVIASLQNILMQNSQSKTPSQYSMKSAQIQTLFDSFYASTLQSYSPAMQIYFSYRFLALHSPEEKRVGILTLSKNISSLNEGHLSDLERIFDNDINDWMICDALANKVVTQFLRSHEDYFQRIYKWKDCGKIWRMRACCVIYVNFANKKESTCLEICSTCVKSSERFVQLGVGCLLREMSLNSTDKVVNFIYDNYRYFTREGLRYSIDKLDVTTRKKILGIGKGRNPVKSPAPSQSTSPNIPTSSTPVVSVNTTAQLQTVDDQLRAQILSMDFLHSAIQPNITATIPVVLPNGQVNYVHQSANVMVPPNYSQYYNLQGFTQNNYSPQ